MEQNTPPVETLATSKTETVLTKIQKFVTIKVAIIIFVLLLIIGLIYFFKNILIAASVNGDTITRLEVIKKLEQNGGGQVLESLITESLIKAEVKKQRITVTDEEVNTEITALEAQFTAQGTTLDAALASSNIDRTLLKEQILFQKQIEKLLGTTIDVKDSEVTEYITTNKITIPKGEEASAKVQIAEQLKAEKMNIQLENLINTLKTSANIKQYVNY